MGQARGLRGAPSPAGRFQKAVGGLPHNNVHSV